MTATPEAIGPERRFGREGRRHRCSRSLERGPVGAGESGEPESRAGARCDRRGETGGLRDRADGRHWRRSPIIRCCNKRYPALADALRGSASPQIRNVATLGGNLLQRPRCWYFRSPAYRCLRKGGGHCFAISGENQYHAIFNNMPCAIVHPSTAATVLVALDATVELTNAAGSGRQLSLEDFFVPRIAISSARTICGRGRS